MRFVMVARKNLCYGLCYAVCYGRAYKKEFELR